MSRVSSWGRLDQADPLEQIPLDPMRVPEALRESRLPGLAFGRGRSYGDVCLNPGGVLWRTEALDHFIAFDAQTGRLVCEAGVLLRDIQQLAVPRGWMLPVTPGTQWVTVGGAIANDVHGKNHHRQGTFGDHVRALTLVRTTGETIRCGAERQSDWFRATVGGLGLTGVIVEADLQLRPVQGPWLDTDTVPFTGLEDFFRLANDSQADWEYTVAWIDCLSGRKPNGVFLRARHAVVGPAAEPSVRSIRMPIDPPFSLVNPLTLRAFNAAYRRLQIRRAGPRLMHFRPFFYPLDALLDWNRMYGRSGFFQHQCVVPDAAGPAAIAEMLAAIAQSGQGSFLAVLKTFGERAPAGMLSFPRSGVTLALDFPHRGSSTLALLARLDAIALDAGGRIYAAKDARMSRDCFEAGYPSLAEFLNYRDPGIRSGLSRRLFGD